MSAADVVHFMFFQALPYVVIVTVVGGSFVRWLVAPYTWKSQSSQLLYNRRPLNLGFILFHIGVILLFFGHLGGLFVPQAVFDFFGLGPATVQMIEITVGGGACIVALIGIFILASRRVGTQRIRKTTRPSDWIVEGIIILVLILGGICVLVAMSTDRSGVELDKISDWAIGVVTFNPDAWVNMLDAPVVLKCHIFVGLMVFLCVPFTRLVHIWSGYLSPIYLFRSHQQMRMGDVPVRSVRPPAAVANDREIAS